MWKKVIVPGVWHTKPCFYSWVRRNIPHEMWRRIWEFVGDSSNGQDLDGAFMCGKAHMWLPVCPEVAANWVNDLV